MDRDIHSHLADWAKSPSRKSLLLRGARQVGKTYSVRVLGRQFERCLEVNFDAEESVRGFFEGDLEPAGICEKLSAFYDTAIVPGQTLLFLDEVQACPNAVRSLRYFHERMPELHVVAAGSLLGFVLQQLPSFGVGRISSLYMYPMSFLEFIRAVAGGGLADMLGKADGQSAIEPAFHTRLLELFRTYCLVGGMPEVVEHYRAHHDLRQCQVLLDELLTTLRDDFAKYRNRVPQSRMAETLLSVAHQTGGKFVFTRASGGESSSQYRHALELLCRAGLVHKIYHTSARGIPLGAEVKENRFKAILLDVGLLQRMLGLELSEAIVMDARGLVNRGDLAETFVGLQLLCGTEPHTRAQLYYWHREARSSNAEVDYVVQKASAIIPIEVKSGKRGAMQSMHRFLAEHNSPGGIRLSQENAGRVGDVRILPVYLAGHIGRPGFLPSLRR